METALQELLIRRSRPLIACLLLALAGGVGVCFVGNTAAQAQSTSPKPPAAPDANDVTLVVGTRFVAPVEGQSPRQQFADARIPLTSFNETDHCLDARALEIAQEYFSTLGTALEKAGYFYVVPEAELLPSLAACERLHGGATKAFVKGQTQVIAFGRVVPTASAPELETSLR